MPWQKVASDVIAFEGKDFLIMVDYYSRNFELDFLPDTRSSTIITKLKAHFSRNGIPSVFHSDNAMYYASRLFQDFPKEWGFTHLTFSLIHPRSNGLAEKTVGIVKSIFRKAKQSGKDPCIAILEYRNCPLECGYSPYQLLYSRRTKSILPITDAQLKPRAANPNNIYRSIQHHKEKQKGYYDKTNKPLPALLINEYVRLQVGKSWFPAKVMTAINTLFRQRTEQHTKTEYYPVRALRNFQKLQTLLQAFCKIRIPHAA